MVREVIAVHILCFLLIVQLLKNIFRILIKYGIILLLYKKIGSNELIKFINKFPFGILKLLLINIQLREKGKLSCKELKYHI